MKQINETIEKNVFFIYNLMNFSPTIAKWKYHEFLFLNISFVSKQWGE